MKSYLLFFLLPVLLFAEGVEGIPKSIYLSSGNIKLRLEASKRWNINRIERNGELLSVDNPSAHYGMTYSPEGSKFFIGSGHTESGEGEVVESLKIWIDGKETPAAEKMSGNVIAMEKVSKILAFTVKYSFRLENNRLYERTEVTALRDENVKVLYCFMHPWATRFSQCHGMHADGRKVDYSLTASEKMPCMVFLPAAAFFDEKSGIIAATFLKLESGTANARRLIWDRKVYRKDYLNDFYHKPFPAGHTAVYSAVTGFADASAANWISEAEKLMTELGK